jgi:hypothetical protein
MTGNQWNGSRCATGALLMAAALGLGSCAASSSSRSREPARPSRSKSVLAGGYVYDAQGGTTACKAPRKKCPDVPPNRSFLDRCKLRGYQIVQCGCEFACTGRVVENKEFYDAHGRSKTCSPEAPDCTPPETSAAFQDACTDHGHELVLCGCEWLCNGKLR